MAQYEWFLDLRTQKIYHCGEVPRGLFDCVGFKSLANAEQARVSTQQFDVDDFATDRRCQEARHHESELVKYNLKKKRKREGDRSAEVQLVGHSRYLFAALLRNHSNCALNQTDPPRRFKGEAGDPEVTCYHIVGEETVESGNVLTDGRTWSPPRSPYWSPPGSPTYSSEDES